ncbi:hypothetical protein GXY_11239 [Novacetimonas hansenii ATCC 23769]|uniref:Uncharacterized protein n=1 Tax=Novacetimonas hansenii ATCC 23769 TaxID=714995 RepID=D5QGH6_NOVHA|nr:hypothetical protein GXY_11239 [Novacetimonas hansenii ATCC 23769]
MFESNSLIKNKKSFWVLPFDRKRRRLLKLSGKSFIKNLYNFSMLLIPAFQTALLEQILYECVHSNR